VVFSGEPGASRTALDAVASSLITVTALTFSLTVLRSVRSSAEGGNAAFVLRLAVTVSFLLALASVIGLVLFLARNAPAIYRPVVADQVERLRASVTDESFDEGERKRFAELDREVINTLWRPSHPRDDMN
jgi:uncharacterized membrane protein